MARRAAVTVAIVVALAASRTADAKCAGPGITAAPASGETAGVSWVFAPPHREIQIGARSPHDIDVAIARVTEADGFVAYRVEVRFRGELPATPRYTVRVEDGHGRVTSFAYKKIKPRQAPAGPVLLEDARYELDRWTCSHTDAVFARPTVAAPAYRIEWARTEAAYRAGDRQVMVVPASMKGFWDRPGTPEIELGHLNCFGETIPAAALAGTVYLGIAPLGPWATPAVPADPIAVRSGQPPLVELRPRPEPEVIEYTCGLAASYEDRIVPAPERQPLPLSLLLALLGALAALPLAHALTRRLSPRTAARLDALSLPQLALVASALALVGPVPIAAAGGAVAVVAASLAAAVSAHRRDRRR